MTVPVGQTNQPLASGGEFLLRPSVLLSMVVLGSAVHAQESAGDAADAARKASLRAAQYVTAEDCARLDDPKLATSMG